MTAYRGVVLEHFRRPHNRGPLADASASAEGANPLCGDRVRVELRTDDGKVTEARFMADACALCVASASIVTDRVRGMTVSDASRIDAVWLFASLHGEPPAGRQQCATLPLDTLHRAIAALPLGS